MNKGLFNLLVVLATATITLIPAKATAYCLQGKTASGEYVREGICAGSNLYFGKKITIYQRLPDGTIGNLIGTYDCLDKGGTDAIRNGYVIDVWKKDLEACQEFMNLVYQDNCGGNIYIVVD